MAKHRGSARETLDVVVAAVVSHSINAPDRFECPDQNRRTAVDRFSHYVQAVFCVDWVDVKRAGRSKHRRVAFGQAACAVAGQIASGQIGFRFDDLSTDPVSVVFAEDRFADQFARDNACLASVKRLVQAFLAAWYFDHESEFTGRI